MKKVCPDCCYPEIIDNDACGCCDGIGAVTPVTIANRPGLSKLAYRMGTHADFLKTMIAQLSNQAYPGLSNLTTRDTADPSIAWLDAWATVADVLTFYQERIANEGYLRTATERRSILELARLVGYKLRPGVASSVFLAYTLDEKEEEEVTVPAGSRVQSIPGPGELPQSFETSEDLKAKSKWNNLKPRMTRPQAHQSVFQSDHWRVYLKGTDTGLKPNDPLLIGAGGSRPEFYLVSDINEDAAADLTQVNFRSLRGLNRETDHSNAEMVDAADLIKALTQRPSLQPRNTLRLKRALKDQFTAKSGTGYRSVGGFAAELKKTLPLAAANAQVAFKNDLKVYALRAKASLFGHNALKEPEYGPNDAGPVSWNEWMPEGEKGNMLSLDRRYDEILPDTYLVVIKIDDEADGFESEMVQAMVFESEMVLTISRTSYGMSGESTIIILDQDWWDGNPDDNINLFRTTKVYAQPEALELAEEPIEAPVCGGTESPLELDGFYNGLESGRWVIVSGERDIAGTSGVRFSELAMLASVTQDVAKETEDNDSVDEVRARVGEKIHTYIKLAEKLEYCFKRDTVTIHGNVVKATHGETRQEVLGSGDGSKALQSFELKQFPLTYVSASNPKGVESTLKVTVNDLQWHETDSLTGLRETDRKFYTQTNDEDKTAVTFGNGREGARLPTGVENVNAQYRNGIGKPGNVNAEQISLLISKPLAVKEVINPLRASGGADREGRDSARKNTPLAVKALDRLVSVQDYEDFSRIYAGIGKARAVEISDGRRQMVHVTIAGADDIPIDETSDLFLNLRQALKDFGDPFLPIQLAVRELMMIVISAGVRIDPDYQWESVVERIRRELLEAFGFEVRELGEDVLLSDIISTIQAVRGVAYVDVDTFGGVSERRWDDGSPGERRLLTPDEITARVQTLIADSELTNRPEPRLRVNVAVSENGVILPAQFAFLTPEVPETLILNQIE